MNTADGPIASVIIAAKDVRPEAFQLCLRSFAALPASATLEILIVASGSVPQVDPELRAAFLAVTRLDVPAAGIYAAYNAGLAAARGRYLLFFGTDDLALPAMNRVLSQLHQGNADVLASACYLQGYGVRRPSRRRASLAFRNWSHQGIFYSAPLIAHRRYRTEYVVRADHELNIALLAQPGVRLEISEEPVAYCSAGGLSALHHDRRFEEDFPALVAAAYGPVLGLLIRARQWLMNAALGPAGDRFRERPL